MRGSGRASLTALSVLLAMLCSLLSTPAQAGDGQNVEPAVNTVINFPAFPLAGGPYITQATVRPTSVSGAGAVEVLLVFNEDIDGTTVVDADFDATGFVFTGTTVFDNCITLNNAVGAASGDEVAISAIGVISAVDASINTDLSPITINEGPVIKEILVFGAEDTIPNNDSILVVFDANVDYGGGDSEDNTFNLTPEFNGAGLSSSQEAVNFANDAIAITYDDTSTENWMQVKAGVSKLWLTREKIVWSDASTTDNNVDTKIVMGNAGPHVVAAYYNDNSTDADLADDILWVVMSEPVDPSSITVPGGLPSHFNDNPDAGGTWNPTDGLVTTAFPGLVTSSLRVTNITVPGAEPTDGVDQIANLAAPDPLLDYQAMSGLGATVEIEVGPGIIRASFDDKQTSGSLADDRLYVWISEPLSDVSQVAVTDFDFIGFDGSSLSVVAENLGSLCRLTFADFHMDSSPPPAGARIKIIDTTGLTGTLSGDTIADLYPIFIEDESRPFTLNINEDLDLTYDRWNETDMIDSIYVAWSESGGDDSDQYFMFIKRLNDGPIDDVWMNANLNNARPLGNLQPYATPPRTGAPTEQNLHWVGMRVIIGHPTEGIATDGIPLAVTDQITVAIAAADYQGNLARILDDTGSVTTFGPFIVGPLCAPRDFITDASVPAEPDSADWDHDVIHVVGDSTGGMVWHYVYGDAGAVPCDADSVLVFDGPDRTTDTFLGSGPVLSDGSFPPIHIDPDDDINCIWLVSRQAFEYSEPTPIIFDQFYPEILGDIGTPYPDYIFDPWNPYRIYNADDYVNIRLLAVDPTLGACELPLPGGPINAPNPLLHIWGDFTRMDDTAGNIPGFGTPADSILFTSLGADLVDNDGDWDNFTDVDDDGEWDLGEPLNDDVGLDGIGGTSDPGEGDGEMTFGDPWVDENGNGAFDPGETFLNRFTPDEGSPGDQVWDPGEVDLDSNDTDESGWYEVRSSSTAVRGTVAQGYHLANPRTEAQLDPYTPVPIRIEDNGIDGAERVTSPDRVLPFTDTIPDSNRTLAHVTHHMGGDPERRFAAVLDLREPTHAEITYLATETGQFDDGPAENRIVAGNPTYDLGRWVDVTSSSLSDDDVLYSRMRIRPEMGAWEDLLLDPPSDANGDGFPGGDEYDEDSDSTSTQTGGFDDDEDGSADEVGEGIDFSDREVHAADQDSTADDAAAQGNGLHAMNDYTDNDNDAFFVYDSYANGGLVGGGDVGKIYWYNIDESRTNNFDDDNDGATDEADEAPESDNYDPESDDNEDGIEDGQSVEIPLSAFSVLAISDPASPLYSAPIPGPGVSGESVFVDAAHVLGNRAAHATEDETTDGNEAFFRNNLAYGELVDAAFEILTPSVRLFPTTGYDFGGAADSATSHEFNWFDTHPGVDPDDSINGNLDFELLSEIYGLTTDGETEHQMRLIAYDQSGNAREVWSEPITFTLDLTAPPATIPGCDDIGDPPTDFADVRPAVDGIQVYDAGKHPDDYTLTATTDDDAVAVTFEASSDPEFGTIDFTFTDVSAPYTAEWPGGGMYTVNNFPAANSDTVYFRALAEDEFGNTTDVDSTCVLTVIVIDGTDPTTVIVEIDGDDDLHDGTCVPPDSSIHIFADVFDNDEDALGNPLDWVAGLDMRTGDALIDDDGDGSTDEDDVDADGLFTAGVDDDGADDIPGTDDDEWNGSSSAGNFGETDDYITNDVYKIIFEYNPVGDVPDLGWLPIETVHGDTFSTGGQTVDWTIPAMATWNTHDLPTGDYDVRAWSCDIEGNCDSLTAFLTTVCIRSEPLRAYILPEVCLAETQFDLYAIHYIHDYEIDKVRFEYYFDADGDDCANDAGSDWEIIALDDDDTGRGDAVLYMPTADRLAEIGKVPDNIEDLAFVEYLNDGDTDGPVYMFWDPEQDGYSHRDPVILDGDEDGLFDLFVPKNLRGAPDQVVIGDPAEIPDQVPLTAFADDEFYADAEGGSDGLEATDWIFRENELNGSNSTLDLWLVTWDATGLGVGNYLVRAIAIDENNLEDVIDYTCYDPANQNPEEIEAITVDTEEPDAEFTTITLPDGTVIDISDPDVQPFIAGSNDWLQICAAGSEDLARVLFEFSLDGGATWDTLDVNNDEDFYADINDTLGFQIRGEDEIFNDVNGNFLYDGDEIDFVRYDGGDGDVDTPIGYPLIPLLSEDPIGDDNGDFNDDDDFDGVVDEDPASGDPLAGEPGSPEDYSDPFCVYLDIASLPLWSDVNVLFRATGSDQLCENFRADPTPDIVAVIIGENMAPEADIIRAEDDEGVEIDVFPSVMDSSGVATISSDTDTMAVFVTAEDVTAIVSVDLYYRLDPSCYPDSSFEDSQWKSMSEAGWTLPDSVYPYDFLVATDLIPDGAYQMYPRAVDEGGNATNAPTNPWGFKKFADANEDFAFVSDPPPPPADRVHVAVGDEFTITGELIDPNAEDHVSVSFFFAPRRLGESIDPTQVQPLAPYTSEPLDETVLTEVGGCDGITLTINGDPAQCYDSLSDADTPLDTDFEYDATNNAIVFRTRPAGTDVIEVSYNFGNWEQIEEGDEFAPYTVEWSAADGGVPDPADYGWNPEHTDAYDLIAVATFDLNGDFEFDEDCDFVELRRSEGNYIILDDVDRPLVMIWGLSFSAEPRENQGDYPDWNIPGNPLFTCGDDVPDDQDWDHAFILSGKETDVFVTAEDEGGGSIDSVSLTITAENPETGEEDVTTYEMTEYGPSAEFIDIPVTFYPKDYPQWDPDDIENVTLYVSTDGGSSWPYHWQMVEKADSSNFQVDARLFIGTTHWYEFEVDLVGDTQERVVDARNNGVFEELIEGEDLVSLIIVPEAPFWYVNIEGITDFFPSRVHHAVATAWDDSGNSGTNLNSGTPDEPDDSQGPVIFIYDVEPPFVQAIFATDDDNRPLNGTRVTPNLSYNLWAVVNDDPYTDFDVLRVENVHFQYSPNQGEIWLDLESDGDPTDGWSISWSPTDGSDDGFDNDGDGQWDEPDELVYEVWIRVVARDCGYNSTYSDDQDPPVILVLNVDAAEPSACPDQPFDGQVFGYSDPITISGTAEGDFIPGPGNDDIAEVRFQARFSNLFYVDQTFNGVGHGGDYDNGIDEIWIDLNSNREFDFEDENVFPGQDGVATDPGKGGGPANIWFTLDPTPGDNSDDPWLTSPNNGEAYQMVWTPTGSHFTQFGARTEGYVDEYVRIRMVATDTAGNDDTGDDDQDPCTKLIILNDTEDNNPRAYVMMVGDEWVDPIEKLVIAGVDPVVVGGSIFNTDAVSHINVYMVSGTDTTLIGITYPDAKGGDHFEINWNAQDLPQGDYWLFATVVDFDQNESSGADATKICVRIDRDAPTVLYACTDGTPWVQSVEYIDDGIVDHNSFAIHPDQYTWDVLFCVNTPDDDITDIVLQWRHASDPDGLWRPLSELLSNTDDVFDYEPNLNFDVDGETRHVWRLHVEDWPDQLLQEGPMHFRALASDQAGNTNALDPLTNVQELTADGHGPTLYDWNDDSVTNQVEVGTTVNFEISAQDDWTDVTMTQLQYRNVTDGGEWTIFDGVDDPLGVQLDTDLGLWISEYAWVAPSWVIHDTMYEFRLVAWDSAWNESTLSPPHPFTITVEDNQAPDRTKLIDILAKVNYTTEDFTDLRGGDGDGDSDCIEPDPTEEHREHDVWFDANGDFVYDAGTDFLVSEGDDLGVQDPFGECGIAMVGDECNTFPRSVGEGFLNDAAVRNEVKVAREVTLVGRTWADDDGIDAGIAYVTFWVQALDGDDNPVGDPRIIGRDEVAPGFPLYYWHVSWNTLELDLHGDRVWADGRYRLGAHAIDQEGNEEDQTSLDWTAAIIVVDNEAPEAQMDADATTPAIERELTVERNEWFTLFTRVLVPGTATEITTEDNTVTWFFKRSRDLNMADSYGMVPNAAGQTPEDGNPDETRPYSFDVLVGELTEPTDEINDPALAVGENYDFIMDVQDEVCNTTDHITAYADSTVDGVGARHVKVHIVDTIPPHLEIVEAVRALPIRPWLNDGDALGDGNDQDNPTRLHAQAFESITARLLTGHRDTEYVEFVYRKVGETAWNLIDADLSSPDSINWILGPWDLRALEHGQWYEVAAVGVDDIGNVDQNPDILEVYVDYEAPEFTLIHPDPSDTTNRWCDFEEISNDGIIRALDLIVEVTRTPDGRNDDVYDVIWEWKASRQDSTQWTSIGVAQSDDLYDDATNRYSNTLNLDELGDEFGTDLYDLRVTLVDESGNYRVLYEWKDVYDEDVPDYVAISNIHWEGDDTTQDPNDQGQYTDVTAGTLVEVFGTASDDEEDLPNERDPETNEWFETIVAVMQFQVAIDLPIGGPDGDDNDGEVWRDLGVVHIDPSDLGDISAQTASVLWNTTGLPEGQYLLRVGATDECQNGPAWSAAANVRVVDNEPPIARIVCWDADQQPHGDDPPSLVTVYALAESDPSIVDVQFQYNMIEAGETSPEGEWVNFGIQALALPSEDFTTETLWYSTIELTAFGPDVEQLWLRALSEDDAGNRYGDNPEDVVPTIRVNIVRELDGTVTFEPVPAANEVNGSEVVQDVQVMIESPTHMILTVDMATADQAPRVIVLAELNFEDETEYPSDDNPENYSPGTEIGLVRSLNDPTIWRGEIFLFGEDEECYQYHVCVTGLDGEAGIAKWIDHKDAHIREFFVSHELGTNGVVAVPAYIDYTTEPPDSLGITVEIPSGAWPDGDHDCLLVSPTLAPLTSHDQQMFLCPVDNTAYHLEISDDTEAFTHGYEAEVVIQYRDSDVDVCLEDAEATEADLTVRRWYPGSPNDDGTNGGWVGSGISHVQVDTVNNTVSFRVDNLSSTEEEGDAFVDALRGESGSYGNIFQLFVPNDSAPVFFASVWPNSPYVSDWWTDPDPQFVIYLREPGGEGIDADEVELLIDGEYWATWLDGAGQAEWVRGNGRATLEYVNGSGTVMALTYFHSMFPRDWLSGDQDLTPEVNEGAHTLSVRFKSDSHEWMDGDQVFYVDHKSPYIEFDGGWVDNPNLINVRGYMNPTNDSLHVALYDGGTGVLFKHDHKWFLPDNDCDGSIDPAELQFDPMPYYYETDDGLCWHTVDWGVKYDVWLVDMPEPGEDDQNDIDEIEERTLIHQGTADELIPWVTTKSDSIPDREWTFEHYYPPHDTLLVPVPVLGGGLIGDKDVLEITWYSEKTIEANPDFDGSYCNIDSIFVNGVTYYVYSECQYDEYGQEMHIYDQGVIDWAGNTGSKYVEQRFIVDMSAPSCEILSPASTVTPEGDLEIHAIIVDDGAGIDDDDITIRVIDPEGNEVEVDPDDLTIEDGVIIAHVHGPLIRGEYTVTITASDRLGNRCNVSKTARVESAVLAMTESYAYPNPVNPAESNAKIHFSLSKAADVTVKVYDFGGNFVTTLESNKHFDSTDAGVIEWGGEASDGTDLANGTYIVRVTATDGSRTEETNLKVVIWRE